MFRYCTGMALIVAFTRVPLAMGDEPPAVSPDEKRLMTAMVEYRTYLTLTLREAKAKRGKTSGVKWVRYVDQQIKEVREGFPVPVMYPWQLKVGAIGNLHGGHGKSGAAVRTENRFKVFQVVDADNLIIETRGSGSYSVDRISEHVYTKSKLLWINMPTNGITDDTFITLDKIYEVTGTKTYATAVGGSKTVFVLKVFPVQDTSNLVSLLKKIEEEVSAKPKPVARDFRTWTDATGGFTVEARFGGIIAGKVTLVKKDGSKVRVTQEQLSEEDRKYLEEITGK